ncbi:MAG: multidrug effflux MFS transporter [Pigmentiphaga sp.]|nr:multidrug effflux MFS transporter [Pigmentiphaga sp.]
MTVSAESTPATAPQSAAARRRFILLLVAVAAISPLGINIYLPSMPGMARSLGVDYATIQVTLSVYLTAVALGQLIVGPLSDRFGRRPVLLIGLCMYVLGSLVCGLAENIFWLNIGRVIQALGGCSGITLTRTMVRDLYDRNQSASMIGYLTMGMSVAPMVAPMVGGLLDATYGWRASFFFLVCFGVPITVLAWAKLRETNPYLLRDGKVQDPAAPRGPARGPAPGLLSSYGSLFCSGKFWGYSLTTSFASGVFFAFVAGAAYVMIELLGRSPFEYGVYFGTVSLGYMTGNFLSGRYAAKVGPDRMIAFGSLYNVASVLIMVLGFGLLGIHHPLMLFLPMMGVAMSNGLVLPSAIAGAVSVRPEVAGAASGLAGSLQMGVAALVAPLVGWLLVDSAWPLLGVMLVASLLSAVSYRMIR